MIILGSFLIYIIDFISPKNSITVAISKSISVIRELRALVITIGKHSQFLIQSFFCIGKMTLCVIVVAMCSSYGFCFLTCLVFSIHICVVEFNGPN